MKLKNVEKTSDFLVKYEIYLPDLHLDIAIKIAYALLCAYFYLSYLVFFLLD
jgi:hypothetical protein